MECIQSGFGRGGPDWYGLLVLLKGLYLFGECDEEKKKESRSSEAETALLERLMDDERLRRLRAHPAQLLFRYIGLLLPDRNRASEAFSLSLTCIDQGMIHAERPLNMLMLISYQTLALYCEKLGQTELLPDIMNSLREHAHRSGWNKLEDRLSKRQSIRNLLSFEYS